MPICSYCKKSIAYDADRCPRCGKKDPVSLSAIRDDPSPPLNWETALGCPICLAAFVAAYYIAGGENAMMEDVVKTGFGLLGALLFAAGLWNVIAK